MAPAPEVAVTEAEVDVNADAEESEQVQALKREIVRLEERSLLQEEWLAIQDSRLVAQEERSALQEQRLSAQVEIAALQEERLSAQGERILQLEMFTKAKFGALDLQFAAQDTFEDLQMSLSALMPEVDMNYGGDNDEPIILDYNLEGGRTLSDGSAGIDMIINGREDDNDNESNHWKGGTLSEVAGEADQLVKTNAERLMDHGDIFGVQIKNKQKWMGHHMGDKDEVLIACPVCRKNFKKDRLRWHIKEVHNENLNKASSESVVNGLSKHSLPDSGMESTLINSITETKILRFSCSKCPAVFDKPGSFRKHLLLKHDIPPEETYTVKKELVDGYICPECAKEYDGRLLYVKHLKAAHSISYCPHKLGWPVKSKATVYICETCKTSYSKMKTFKGHLQRKHDKSAEEATRIGMNSSVAEVEAYRCHLCEHDFINDVALKNHWEVVHAVKFPRVGQNLEQVKVLKYVCDKCPVEYAEQKYLVQHLQKVHNVPVEEANTVKQIFVDKYVCSTCHRDFAFESSFFKHLKLQSHSASFILPILAAEELAVAVKNSIIRAETPVTVTSAETTPTIRVETIPGFVCHRCDLPFESPLAHIQAHVLRVSVVKLQGNPKATSTSSKNHRTNSTSARIEIEEQIENNIQPDPDLLNAKAQGKRQQPPHGTTSEVNRNTRKSPLKDSRNKSPEHHGRARRLSDYGRREEKKSRPIKVQEEGQAQLSHKTDDAAVVGVKVKDKSLVEDLGNPGSGSSPTKPSHVSQKTNEMETEPVVIRLSRIDKKIKLNGTTVKLTGGTETEDHLHLNRKRNHSEISGMEIARKVKRLKQS